MQNANQASDFQQLLCFDVEPHSQEKISGEVVCRHKDQEGWNSTITFKYALLDKAFHSRGDLALNFNFEWGLASMACELIVHQRAMSWAYIESKIFCLGSVQYLPAEIFFFGMCLNLNLKLASFPPNLHIIWTMSKKNIFKRIIKPVPKRTRNLKY